MIGGAETSEQITLLEFISMKVVCQSAFSFALISFFTLICAFNHSCYSLNMLIDRQIRVD